MSSVKDVAPAHSAGLVALLFGAAVACTAPRPRGDETAGGAAAQKPGQQPGATGPETDQERIQRLEREARALARADGCQNTSDCRAAPVGDRPCGGPRTYVVYCGRTTDSVALYHKLDELAQAEREYNRKQGLMSTCEFRMPPAVVATGGSCRAAAP